MRLFLNTHSVYTCCNHFMDIFETPDFLLVCCTSGPPTEAAQPQCVFAERDLTVIAAFSECIKGERSNIYCLACRNLRDKHGLGIVLIITGIKLHEGKRSRRTDRNIFLSRCVLHFWRTNVTSA